MTPDLNESSTATSRDAESGLPPSGQSAQDLAHAESINNPLPKIEQIAPWVVLFFLIAFVVAAWYPSVLSPPDKAAIQSEQISTLFLALLTASFGIWFILAFTSSPWPLAKRKQCFRFAYSFTITTFIVLMFPFLELWKPDIAGPIGLVRGCVEISDQRSNEQLAPLSVSCTTLGRKAEPAKNEPGSSTTGNPAAATAGDQPVQTSGSEATATYPWLLTIGGFVGKTICKQADGTETDCANRQLTDPTRHSIITNGLVVPFYVVFLAFIGGAVSLTRRIPEYQKRADEDYKPPSDLAAVSKFEPYEARESVVFQIMQLISAPFIAITAYWVIAPSTVAATIGLAFVSGFASETILLLIRGVVDGIRPQTSMFSGKKMENTGPKADTDTAQATPSVTVRLAVEAEDIALDPDSLTLTVDSVPVPLPPGRFLELPLATNRAHVLVASGRSNGEVLRGEITITPTVDDDAKPISIILSRQSR